ncbi:hypothetical protein DAI22_10g141100 [Oryza sativa Japonica Group]|nr:hypothetical protein DAI22_10g141100 [Oryza sativa Japonica Group]
MYFSGIFLTLSSNITFRICEHSIPSLENFPQMQPKFSFGKSMITICFLCLYSCWMLLGDTNTSYTLPCCITDTCNLKVSFNSFWNFLNMSRLYSSDACSSMR